MRLRWALALSTAVLGGGAELRAADSAPPAQRFEISINGENFTVESGVPARLESKDHPGQSYRVAVRLATMQHWKLNTVGFDYQLGFQILDDQESKGRSATLKHPLGFVLVITDLGGALAADAKSSALEQLVEGMRKSLRGSGIEDVKVSKPQRRKLGANAVEAVTFSYLNSSGGERLSAVYLVSGEKFTCSCLLQCDDANQQDAIDMVKATIASMAPAER